MTKFSPFYKQILGLEQNIIQHTDGMGFTEATKTALGSFDLSTFNGMQTLAECLPLTKNIAQYYSATGFGKFNLTLVNNGKFFILAMFMDDISTEIHDHPFEGAFMPLAGSPHQLQFNFQKESSLDDYIDKGQLTTLSLKKIAPGEITVILKESIHMLSRPSNGQFSLLVCRILPQEVRQNHFYLSSGHKIKNRSNLSYLARVISSFQAGAFGVQLDSLAADELIQLYFRTSIQLAQTALEPELVLNMRKELSTRLNDLNLLDAISEHQTFLHKIKSKINLLES